MTEAFDLLHYFFSDLYEKKDPCGCGCPCCRKKQKVEAFGDDSEDEPNPDAPEKKAKSKKKVKGDRLRDPYNPGPTHYENLPDKKFLSMVKAMKKKYAESVEAAHKLEARVIMKRIRRMKQVKRRGVRRTRY